MPWNVRGNSSLSKYGSLYGDKDDDVVCPLQNRKKNDAVKVW